MLPNDCKSQSFSDAGDWLERSFDGFDRLEFQFSVGLLNNEKVQKL